MKRIRLGLVFLVLALLSYLVGARVTDTSAIQTDAPQSPGVIKTDAPLPRVKIIQPGPAIGEPLAAFSGAWFGRWEEEMDHLLIIERIESPQKIMAVDSWGKGFGKASGWDRVTGVFVEKDNELQLLSSGKSGAFVYATYRMLDDGTLKAVWRGRAKATMKRVDLNLISK